MSEPEFLDLAEIRARRFRELVESGNLPPNVCSECGGGVSKKREKRWNRVQRPDGGWDHREHDGAHERRKDLLRAARKEHRSASRRAATRGDDRYGPLAGGA